MLRAGDTLGEYEIVARIRSGGMATLYLARRRGAAGFAKPVAIKMIHPHLAEDPAFVRMFVDEARLSAAIADPRVVHVEELAQHDGMLFLVMEYVHGCSLAQLMRVLATRGRRMAPELAIQIAIQLCDGLHAAHEVTGDDGKPLGLVHRDVSPQNVLLSYRGHVKVIDFGIAKARTASSNTTAGSLRGKVAYMSPEQAWGRAVDRRTDVYAAAIVLWEMLTHRRLFEAETELALLELVRAAKIAPPSTFAPVAKELDDVVMAALSADADARPSTASELRRRLAAAVPGSLRIDAAELGAFVGAVMHEQLEKTRALLPESFDQATETASSATAEELVKTLSIDAGGTLVIRFDDEPDPAPLVSAGEPAASRATKPTRTRAWALALLACAAIAGAFALGLGARRSNAANPPVPTASPDLAASAPPASVPTAAASDPPASIASTPPVHSVAGRHPIRPRPAAARSVASTPTPPPTAISTFGTTPIAPKAPF